MFIYYYSINKLRCNQKAKQPNFEYKKSCSEGSFFVIVVYCGGLHRLHGSYPWFLASFKLMGILLLLSDPQLPL